MNEQYLKYIENCLTQLDKSTTWVFLTLIAIVLSNTSSDSYEFGTIKIKKANSALVFFFILCGLNFQILKYLQNLSNAFFLLKDKSIGISILQNHTWLFNPFSKTTGIIGSITDNIGLPFLIILWWLGFALASKELFKESNLPKFLAIVLFFTYLLLGLLSLFVIQNILLAIGNSTLRLAFQLFGILIGCLAYYFIEKKEKFLKYYFK